jgi:rubredoxin
MRTKGMMMSEGGDGASGAQWACVYCGYVYDETKGDPDTDVAPGTRWEDLPEDWCCPVCSSDKTDFEKA